MNDWLRSTDPLLKMAAGAVWVLAAVFVRSPVGLSPLMTTSFVLLIYSGAFHFPWRLLATLMSIGLVGALHLALGGTPEKALATAMRLTALGGVTAALILTTDPARLLRSLRRLPLPGGVLLGLTILWRALPLLKRELSSILFACRIEGVRPGLLRPATAYRYVALPLAFSMVSLADDMALALTTRGVDLTRKPLPGTTWRPSPPDTVLLVLLLISCVLAGGLQTWA